MAIYDVLIIGGGVTGTAIARELSRYRLKIALLEKEAELSFGVSKSNSGIIHPGTQNPPDSLKGKLCVQGNKLTRQIAKELGVDFKEVGELIVIFKEEDRARLLEIKEEGEKLGVPGLQIVERAWLREHEPNLNPEALAALYAPTAGIISPYRWVYDLAENAARNGVEILLNHQVVGISKDLGNQRPACRQARLNVAVSIREEPRAVPAGRQGLLAGSERVFEAKYLINVAGLYADEIAKMAGINDIVIKPRKGEEFLLDKKREHLVNHIIFPLPTPTTKGILVIKTSDGNPMIGPTAEDIEDKEDRTTSDAGLQHVLSATRQLVPSLNENDIIAYFAGLRPIAGKDFIIRHEEKIPGMITVAGIQSPGLTAAPAIALMVSDLLEKNGLKLRRKFFFHRFRQATIHLFAIPFAKTRELIKKNKAYGEIVCRCEMVSVQEVRDAIKRGARTLDGIKFRTRGQAGRCHGGFCTTRIMKIMAEELKLDPKEITKRGRGSEVIKDDRAILEPENELPCLPAGTVGSKIQEPRRSAVPAGRQVAGSVTRELVIVGGGPAGMAAALAAQQAGVKDILLLERDQYLGGILNQCIHPGFGLHHFKADLTGPEYADRFIKQVAPTKEIEVSLKSFVVKLTNDKIVTYIKPGELVEVKAKAIIMATGCRERTREMIHVAGTRPAGIYPAGLAQKMINIEGWLPGKEVVIIGSGDIGLIMARRFTLEGAKVKAVIEILPESRGLVRNVVQCLEDFQIPLYLKHRVARIHGQDRVEKVTVENTDTKETFDLTCDTVLISVGLIPENELIEMAGVADVTQINIPGLFVCGNSFKVYDLVDSVTRDSEKAGQAAAEYLKYA